MTTPGNPSATFNFSPSNAQILLEAFERVGVKDGALVRSNLDSAHMSLNLELQRWSNLGINAWKVVSGSINLVTGQLVYTLPTNLIALTELYYTTVNGNGSGYNSDRIMVPITRTQYAMIPNKAQPGTPTQYWFERLAAPQITIWQPASAGAPAYVLNWFGLQRIQDAGIATGETPDLVYRAYDALCDALAYRLYPKIVPRQEWPLMEQILLPKRERSWAEFAGNDIEPGPVIIQPNIAAYGRI